MADPRQLRPYVAGQTVLVRLFRDGKQIHQQTERLQPLPGGKVGFFQTPWKANRDGRIVISAVHLATPELDTVRSEKERVLVVKPIAGNGGVVVRLLQRGLSKLHYVTSRNGIYDDATARAVMAWRKVTGMARTFSPSEAVVRGVLAGRGKFKVRYPKHGHHVEADLSRQVLALIGRRGEVERIYHISSGKPSTPTVLGSFKVYRKSPGTNSHGMVHSSYFIGGYAIHGYVSGPDLRGKPRLPARTDPERVVDLRVGADGRRRRRVSVDRLGGGSPMSRPSTERIPPAACAARMRSAPLPSRRRRCTSSSASSSPFSRA